MKRVIHIHQNTIRCNIKKEHNDTEPPIIVRTYKGRVYCYEVEFKGDSKCVYRPHDPLSCGARIWIETEDPVICFDKEGKKIQEV